MEQPFGHTQVPIAIVGMACRLPGADNLDQYWDLLSRGGSAVGELPPERLDQELYYDPKVGTRGKSYAKLGSIVSSRQFDNRACPISAELERGVDNAHLLMCQTAAQACRHAGMDPFNLPLRNTGVYIGHAQGSSLAGDLIYGTCIEEGAQFLREVSGFADLPQAEQDAIIQELVDSVRSQLPKRSADSPDVSINMVAGTISKAFQLSGPFLGLNSACASSLQTVMVAARALQLGRIDMAIVGGASDCKGDSLVLFSQAQSMSSTGTRPFDADADGLICAEGYVALVLKTLPRALADGDPIQAIVLGAGMSSDGKGKSLWAPRKEGQVKAMERAYRNGLDMGSLQYIEAHATSTSLGDATELNSLADILADKFTPGKKIPVASVKANIGHALEAAGVSSLIKTVLCLQHRTFVPAINIKALNTKIDWEKVPFYVPLQAAPWPEQPDGLPRRAGVNAFGIGGLNMHVVLEEFTEERRARLREMWPASTIPRAGGAASEDEQAVAIIGMGCILPGADHPAKLWDLIASGRDPKGPTPAGRWRTDIGHEPGAARAYRTPSILGGYITEYAYDWRKHKQPPKQVQQADPLQFMLLDTADQALVDAGYDKKNFDRTRVGVLVGTEFGGDFSTQLGLGLRLPHIASLLKPMLARRGTSAADAERITDELAEVMLKHWPALIDESGSFSTSTLASRITKTMNLMGGAAAIDASNTSSAAALAIATDILVSGDCDMMICAGGQRCMNLPQYEGLALAGSLASGDHPPAPFDATATGIVPGEGVAVVLLKRLGDARRDGDKIHAIIRGIGAAHAEAAEQSIELAINRAMENARVDPADVALVEMDGTGLPERDQDQVCALIATYGKSKRAEPLLVSSITGQIGHTIGASAMVSLVKASLEVEKGQMHATVGLKTPLPVVSQNSGQIQAVTAPLTVRHTSRDGRRLAAVSSYGKGLAYHILLERGEKVAPSQRAEAPTSARQPLAAASPAVSAPPMSAAAECKILRLGAATAAELTAKIERALADPTRAFGEPTEFVAADRLRLGVVASSADALAKKLQIAAKQFANPDAQPVLDQQGCFYRRLPVRRPRVAFVFPGQGSQYPGMLRELVRDVPAAMTAMQEIDAVMQARGYQTFGQMAWERPEQLGADIWVTQVVMLLADLIVHRSLVDMQIQPDLVTGHSYGEFAALTAAGVWDFEGVLTAARARYEAIRAISGARGTMMATNAPAALVEQTAARLANRPYIANYNAPDQTVVGGTPEVLAQLAEQLTAARHKCQMLPVPCPFHTPLMEGVGPLLKRTLDTLRMRPPRVPMLSSITNRYVAEPDDIRANLAAQLTTPVRYVDLVERIVNEQDTVFVEVGPQQALTKLNRRILEKRSVAGVVACDNPKYPGLEPLYHVRALAECLGLVPSESRIAEKVQVGGASQPASVVGAVRPAAASQPPGKQPTEIANARSNTVDQSKPKRGTITHVDATERRIAKMRQKAADGGRTSNGKSGEPTAPSRAEPALPSGNGPAGASRISPAPQPAVSKPAAPAQVSRPAMPVTPAPPPAMSAPRAASPTRPIPAASHSGVANAAQAPPAASGLNAAELEKFLVNFVVEQTGYPPEVVELDADMEADLGIDSIKRAQLFGELAEYFDVQPGENLTLDDFPTLRHVMNFLVGASAKSSVIGNGAAASMAPAPAPAPVATAPAPAARVASAPVCSTTKLTRNFSSSAGFNPPVAAGAGVGTAVGAILRVDAAAFTARAGAGATLAAAPLLTALLLAEAPTKKLIT
jgi:acyl transferase domain-containing protein